MLESHRLRVAFVLSLLCAGCTPAPGHVTAPTRVPAVRPAHERPCAPARLLPLDIASWLGELEGASDLGDADALLSRARAMPLGASPPWENAVGRGDVELSFVEGRVLEVALAPGPPSDRVISLFFKACEASGTCWYHQRFLVLRSVDDDVWCQLEHSFDLDQESTDQACLLGPAGEQDEPLRLSPLRLIADDVDSFVVSSQHGRCDGIGRSAEWTQGYYHARGDQLEELFTRVAYSASYASPVPPTREESTVITPTGPFPRRLDVVHRVECPDHRDMCSEAESACEADTRFYDPDCEPSEERSRYRFDGKRYVSMR